MRRWCQCSKVCLSTCWCHGPCTPCSQRAKCSLHTTSLCVEQLCHFPQAPHDSTCVVCPPGPASPAASSCPERRRRHRPSAPPVACNRGASGGGVTLSSTATAMGPCPAPSAALPCCCSPRRPWPTAPVPPGAAAAPPGTVEPRPASPSAIPRSDHLRARAGSAAASTPPPATACCAAPPPVALARAVGCSRCSSCCCRRRCRGLRVLPSAAASGPAACTAVRPVPSPCSTWEAWPGAVP